MKLIEIDTGIVITVAGNLRPDKRAVSAYSKLALEVTRWVSGATNLQELRMQSGTIEVLGEPSPEVNQIKSNVDVFGKKISVRLPPSLTRIGMSSFSPELAINLAQACTYLECSLRDTSLPNRPLRIRQLIDLAAQYSADLIRDAEREVVGSGRNRDKKQLR